MGLSPEENKKLIERYPFLLPRNRWTDEVVEDFDYSWTEMDAMPAGWRIAFGNELLEELREILVKANFLEQYRIVQIKEKFGALRWYCREYPADAYEELDTWEKKYERKSAYTCIRCGAPAAYITYGYIEPYCPDCHRRSGSAPARCVAVEEFYDV